MPSILALSDVHKAFGDTQIIRGVDLELRQGERHAVIGPNGAGKSTVRSEEHTSELQSLMRTSYAVFCLKKKKIHKKIKHQQIQNTHLNTQITTLNQTCV